VYVYIWKTQEGQPFYVGISQNVSRPNPKRLGHRNSACKAVVQAIGPDAVVIELHSAPNPEAAKQLEKALIAKYGRLSDGTGTLTNKSPGGEFHRAAPATRSRLKELWTEEAHREKMKVSRTGKKRVLTDSTKDTLRANLKANAAMVGWSGRNGKDAAFDAKRIAGIRLAQPKRAEKMKDPVALAKRKARLRETLNSDAYKAKRALWDTPEYRAKLAAAKREYWARKKETMAAIVPASWRKEQLRPDAA
jgi:hypothetical protein